jgi:general secretion pathway protein J
MSERGFTLIEVLVALALTALVAMMAYASLSAAISASESTRLDAERLQTVDRLFQILQRDIGQAVSRPISDGYGEIQPALRGGVVDGELLLFTRSGWPNARQQLRSDLQRVRYRSTGDTLWRDYWEHTDIAPGTQPISTRVASGLPAVRMRFLGPDASSFGTDSSEWRDSWLTQSRTDGLPLAVEVILELQAWGEIRRLFVLPDNA